MSIYDAEPIQFVERGVKFYVFLDREFDFNTHQNYHSKVKYSNRMSKRSPKTKGYKGIKIERDYRRRIKRIGNVFINL